MEFRTKSIAMNFSFMVFVCCATLFLQVSCVSKNQPEPDGAHWRLVTQKAAMGNDVPSLPVLGAVLDESISSFLESGYKGNFVVNDSARMLANGVYEYIPEERVRLVSVQTLKDMVDLSKGEPDYILDVRTLEASGVTQFVTVNCWYDGSIVIDFIFEITMSEDDRCEILSVTSSPVP